MLVIYKCTPRAAEERVYQAMFGDGIHDKISSAESRLLCILLMRRPQLKETVRNGGH
jgi:hypothetical protein